MITSARCLLVGLLIAVAPLVSRAEEPRRLVVGTSDSIPPFVIAGNNSGIVIDIIRAALEGRGYQVEFTYAPNNRLTLELSRGRVDGVYNLPLGLLENAHYSIPVIRYLNVAVSLAERDLEINDSDDLAALRVAGFQNATGFLGGDFAAMAEANANYFEVSDQRSQVTMLYSGRVDAIVLDLSVFRYLRETVAGRVDTSAPVTIHPILPPAERFAAFLDPNVRDDFNNGLTELRQSGEYQAIVTRYLPALPALPTEDQEEH